MSTKTGFARDLENSKPAVEYLIRFLNLKVLPEGFEARDVTDSKEQRGAGDIAIYDTTKEYPCPVHFLEVKNNEKGGDTGNYHAEYISDVFGQTWGHMHNLVNCTSLVMVEPPGRKNDSPRMVFFDIVKLRTDIEGACATARAAAWEAGPGSDEWKQFQYDWKLVPTCRDQLNQTYGYLISHQVMDAWPSCKLIIQKNKETKAWDVLHGELKYLWEK